MRLLKTYQHYPHNKIFKFIDNNSYLYMIDAFVMMSDNYHLLEYTKVPKGYKHETIKNI